MELLTEKEASKFLSVSVGTMRTWRSSGKGPAHINLGKRLVRYRKDILDKFIRDGEVKRGK